jgi:dihydroorotate dehydrogenase electron transfer subunit
MDIEAGMGNPRSLRVYKTRGETSRTVTLQFRDPNLSSVDPGQFFMVWVPGVDEIPMSLSFWEQPLLGITVQAIGTATTALSRLETGQWVGFRGPFGRPFSLNSEKALIVGGGVGIAPLRPLVDSLLERGTEVMLVVAARTEADLILFNYDKQKLSNFSLEIATDDGTRGLKALAPVVVERLLEKNEYDRVYACGPEPMMYKIVRMAQEHGISVEASLERYMKCGCGICGTCAMDSTGHLVCVDGPVFTGTELEKIDEFGQYCRGATGTKKV